MSLAPDLFDIGNQNSDLEVPQFGFGNQIKILEQKQTDITKFIILFCFCKKLPYYYIRC